MSSIQNQNGNLVGTLKPQGVLTGTVNKTLGVLKGKISKPTLVTGDLPIYDGPHIITPLVDNPQILSTAGRYTKHDIIVEEIPYAEVSNSAGGTTVIIG